MKTALIFDALTMEHNGKAVFSENGAPKVSWISGPRQAIQPRLEPRISKGRVPDATRDPARKAGGQSWFRPGQDESQPWAPSGRSHGPSSWPSVESGSARPSNGPLIGSRLTAHSAGLT
jgi:hypothetical protein